MLAAGRSSTLKKSIKKSLRTIQKDAFIVISDLLNILVWIKSENKTRWSNIALFYCALHYQQYKSLSMRSTTILIVLALVTLSMANVSLLTAADILSFTPNPNNVFKEVQFRPLSYAGIIILS